MDDLINACGDKGIDQISVLSQVLAKLRPAIEPGFEFSC